MNGVGIRETGLGGRGFGLFFGTVLASVWCLWLLLQKLGNVPVSCTLALFLGCLGVTDGCMTAAVSCCCSFCFGLFVVSSPSCLARLLPGLNYIFC